jgi:uncharacterized heparinase superfamily protein
MTGRPRGGGQAADSVVAATGPALLGRMRAEWRATPFYAWSLSGPKTAGLAAVAKDPRPVDPEVGRHILLGRVTLAGGVLEIGVGGDPWEVASPSRAFAAALHRFAWLPNLLTQGEAGADEALRLVLDWLRLFGRVTPFIWGAETAERRTLNLACGLGALMERASEAEGARLVDTLAQHGRHLLRLDDGPLRRAERACAAATVGAMLAGKAGRRLGDDGLSALVKALKTAVLPDGGLKSRNPEQGLELLFDLLTLDDVLLQRGREAPPEVSRNLDRLTQATRFFTLGGGRLAAFQGGGAVSRQRTGAALARDDGEARVQPLLPHAGYHRLSGRTLHVVIDTAPPASGAWSVQACAQPLALEIACGPDTLIAGVGWSAEAQGPDGLRLTAGGSTASLGEAACGRTLKGFAARGLGRRLVDGPRQVTAERRENEAGVWLESAHDGWAARFGISHQRRLFLNPDLDELRGEDHFAPTDAAKPPQRASAYTVRFHLPPEVKVSLARDKRSVLLRGPSNQGWWFRNDAPDVLIEPSVHFEDHLPKRCAQIVLKGPIVRETGARVRWKLAPIEVDAGARAASPGIAAS